VSGLWLLTALAANATPSPCAEPDLALGPSGDAATAAIYRAVGDQERAAGNLDAARFAYRQALRHDGADPAARSALEALCRAGAGWPEAAPAPAPGPTSADTADLFSDAVAKMKRGDRASAVLSFESARRRSGSDAAAALLEGICLYELGDERRAQPLFEEARAAPEVAGTALLFLGLIALHEDQEARAASLFAGAATHDGELAAVATVLGRIARRSGRVVISALGEAGYDSNLALAPDGTANRAQAGDGYTAGVGDFILRPWGAGGPYARAGAQYRKQLREASYDVGQVAGALGLRAVGQLGSAGGEYGFELVSLGAHSYLRAHHLLGSGRLRWRRFSLAASYAARLESFLTAAADPYSGVRQDAETEAGWQASQRWSVALGYHGALDTARLDTLSYREHGPFAVVALAQGRARLSAAGRLTLRRYGALDADRGAQRQDRYLDGAVLGEWDVSNRWTLRASVGTRRASSNISDFAYAKLTATLGLLCATGLP